MFIVWILSYTAVFMFGWKAKELWLDHLNKVDERTADTLQQMHEKVEQNIETNFGENVTSITK